MVKKSCLAESVLCVLVVAGRIFCMQDGQQPLSLMTVNRGSCPSLAENSPMVFIQPSFIDFDRRGCSSPVTQILAKILLSKQMQRTQAEQVFFLQVSIEELRKQVDTKEKELESLTRQSDWERQERDNFDALVRELEKGGSLAPSFARSQDRSFFVYLRDQACFSHGALLLQKLLEADPYINADLQSLGLFALTDDPQEVTDSAEKMQVLAQAGVDLYRMKSVDSCPHMLIRDSKEDVVRAFIEKNPAILNAVDGKGRTGLDVAVERYMRALSEKGRRSSECDEAYKILKFLVDQQQAHSQQLR